MAPESAEVDIAAVKESLKNAGLLPSERYLEVVSEELAQKGLREVPQILVCNSNYCIIVRRDDPPPRPDPS